MQIRRKQSVEQAKAAEYQKLGAQIEAMYDAVHPNRSQLYRTAFLKGVASGVGGVIGATVVIALLIWALSLFSEVPFLGHFVESVRTTLQRH